MNAPSAARRWYRTGEYLLVFAVVAGLTLEAGYRSAAVWQVNWGGLAAVAHAHDVWYRAPEPRLSQIGFVEPPLSALAATVGIVPRPAAEVAHYAPARVGAVLLGLVAVVFLGFTRRLGVWPPVGYALTAALVLHPYVLGNAAGGSASVLLLLLTLAGITALDRWASGGQLRYLVTAGFLFALMPLVRWEMALWVLVAVGFVVRQSGRQGGYARAEAQAVAFAVPAVYVAAGWLLSSWLIQGDALYFWRLTFASPGEGGWGELIATGLWLAVLVSPALPGALYYTLASPALRREARASLALLAGSAAVVVIAAPLLLRLTGDGWTHLTSPLVVTVAVGHLLLARACSPHRGRGSADRARGWVALALVGLGLLATVGLSREGLGLPRSVADSLGGRLAFTGDCRDEAQAALRLRRELRPGERAIIAGWPGYAVALFVGDLQRVTVVPETIPARPRFEAQDVLLLREERPGEAVTAWEGALASGTVLVSVWRVGEWNCYRVAPLSVQARGR